MRFFSRYCYPVLLLLLLIILNPIFAQQLSQDPLYRLVFEDNFDSVDYNKWKTSWYWGNNMWNSNFARLCNPPNFPESTVDVAYNSQFPEDTNRTIITSGEDTFQRMYFKRGDLYGNIIAYHSPCPSEICIGYDCDTNSSGLIYCYYDSLVPFKFSGAMLLGKEKYKYGYIEMRYKLRDLRPSENNAYGPNLWMWASDTSAGYSEIDIFEQRGTDWRMAMNFHFRKTVPDSSTIWADTVFWHGVGQQITPSSPYPSILDYSLQYNGGVWHTVGCEWTPDHIDTYYDSDDTTRRFSRDKIPVYRLTAMPIVVDLYMPAAQYCIPFNDSLTNVPFFYDIDYIRVYQINQVCNCDSISGYFPTFDTNQFSSNLYRDITIGGGGNAVLNDGSYHIAGQDFVVLLNGFEASGNANVVISTTPCQPDQLKVRTTMQAEYEMPNSLIIEDFRLVKGNNK